MLYKACASCGKLIPYGKTYCDRCEPIIQARKEAEFKKHKKFSDRKYDCKRDKKYVRFYNSADWKSLAFAYTVKKMYKCENCGKIATQVHHKIPIQTEEGWERRLDINNLELLCTSCHNARHHRFKSRKPRGG